MSGPSGPGLMRIPPRGEPGNDKPNFQVVPKMMRPLWAPFIIIINKFPAPIIRGRPLIRGAYYSNKTGTYSMK